ncbi:MAG: hypothetical protein DIJKHBIC_02334 [Thermoanaerobaculia bacterium]|nr:hypothetical protein [Thermoanaerobaculia bacterium]
MQRSIFYSWQSDLPNSTNRTFIQTALENVAKAIRQDDSLQVDPVIDRDTRGLPGSPDIATSILEKIAAADVFVADVSLIHPREFEGRRTPNPNVLLELGYAIRSLGWDRIVMVTNTAVGSIVDLPFDLKQRRALPYVLQPLPEEGSPEREKAIQERKTVRRELERSLDEAIRTILLKVEASEPPRPGAISPLERAIEGRLPSQGPLARAYIGDFMQRLAQIAPVWTEGCEMDEVLFQSIEKTIPLAAEFARLCEAISVHGGQDAARSLYGEWGLFLERYQHKPIGGGPEHQTDYDFYRFLGHEFFVMLFAFLLRDRRWSLISDLLGQGIYNPRDRDFVARLVRFYDVSVNVELLHARNTRLEMRRISIHGDLLKERHSSGALSAISPFQEFTDADYLLYLRSELEPAEPPTFLNWRAWSTIHVGRSVPRFVAEAEYKSQAENLVGALGLPDLTTLIQRLRERPQRLSTLFREGFRFDFPWPDPERIGKL